jgi:hypothetical protein
MSYETYIFTILGLLSGGHFAYSIITAHRIKAQYQVKTQVIRHQGVTSVATGFKPRVQGH